MSGKQEVDTDAVTARGRQLEAALAEHGVQTRLVGMVVGPTVTRYELELGVGREGQRRHQPVHGHRLQHGLARRAHHRPDPRQAGDRRRGAQHARARSWRSATSSPRPRRTGPPTRSRSAVGRDIEGRAVMVQPGDDAPHPHRRSDRRRQELVHQLDHDVDPHAGHARPGAPDPRRPEAGRADPVQPGARTCSPRW